MSKALRSDPLLELGMKLSPSDRVILSILIELSDADSMLTIREIAQKANAEYGLDVSQNWVYKCVEGLAGLGLVRVDRLRRPAACFTAHEVICKSLEQLIDSRVAELVKRKQAICEETTLLESVTADSMAESLISALAAPRNAQGATLVLGVETVLSTILDMMTREVKQGSTIRFMQGVDAVPETVAALGSFERGVFDAINRGAKVRALITATSDINRDKMLLVEFVDGVKGSAMTPFTTGNLQLRFHPGPMRSYRMMSVDASAMLLFMSESYMPEAAVILRSPHDGRIIEDAIRTFEEKWTESIDVAGLIMSTPSLPKTSDQ